LNSGFEQPDFTNPLNFPLESAVPGWDTSAPDNQIEVWRDGFNGVPAFEGDQFVELNANFASTFSQTFTPTAAGGDLALTFAHRGRVGADTMNVTAIDLGANGVLGGGDDVVLFNQNYTTGNTAWQQYQADLGTASGNAVLLQFNSVSAAGGDPTIGNFLDAIDIFDSTQSTTTSVGLSVTPVADAVDDTVTTNEEAPITFNVLTGTNGAEADNFENPARAVTSITQPANGSVTFAADGTMTYTPNANFNATDTFTYTVTSPAGITETATVTVTVNDVNDPPVATPSTSAGDEDTNIPVALAGTDPDGTVDFVTVTTLPPATQGVLYLADGVTPVVAGTPITAAQAATLIFDPAPDFNGDVTIPFTVTDNDGGVSTPASEVITVNAINDPPVATASTSSGDEDTNIPVALVGTDVDGTVDFVTVTTLPPATQGVLYLADGVTPVVAGTPLTAAQAATLIFDPAPDFNGDVTIPFTVTDDDGTVSAPANEVITVNAINDPPVAVNDGPVAVVAGVATNIDVLANDTDVDGGAMSVSQINGQVPTAGVPITLASGTQVTLNGDGSIGVVLAPGISDTETFTYQVSDGNGGTATATVTLARDSDGDGVANADDIDDDNDGILDTTEDALFAASHPPLSGAQTTIISASGVPVVTRGTDGLAGTPGATALWANAGTVNGTPIDIRATVLSTDGTRVSFGTPNGNDLRASLATGAGTATLRWEMFVAGTNQTVAISGNPGFRISDLDGYPTGQVESVSTPAAGLAGYILDANTNLTAGFVGPNVSITGTQDQSGEPSSMVELVWNNVSAWTVTYELLPGPRGNADFFHDGNRTVSFSAAGTTETVISDTDADGIPDRLDIDSDNDGITDNVEAQTTAGYIAPTGTGAAMVDADGDGLDDAYDATGASGAAGSLGLSPVNTDGADLADYLDADSDNDGLMDAAERGTAGPTTAATAASTPGTDADGDGLFDVFEGANTTDGFDVNDEHRDGSAANGGTYTLAAVPTLNAAGTNAIPLTRDLSFRDVNDPPVATPSTSSGDEDTNIPVALVGTDVDGTVDFVTVTTLPPATQGVLYLADGVTPVVAGTPITAAQAATLIFDPAPNFNGDVTIPFTVTDNDGGVSTPANEVITVNDVNDPPVATPSTSSGDEDTNIPVALVGTDIDGTVDFVTVTTLPPATQGVLYLADGVTPVVAGTPLTAAQAATLIFDPALNFNGDVTIPFTVTDNDGTTSAPANEVITVNDVNDPPVATPSTSSGDEDTNIPVALVGTDPDGTVDFVTVTTLPPATQGVLYLADGVTPVVAGTPLTAAQAATLIFDPALNFNGDVTIPFTVTDNDGTTSASANEVITVNDVNDPPVATPSTSAGDEDTNIPVDLTGTDPDGTVDFVTVTTLPPATQGVLYLADGVTPVVAGTPLTAVQAANLIFDPAPNFNGDVTIPFTVTDNDGTISASANEVITVNDVNDPPVATPSTSSGDEDTNVPVALVGTDPDGTVDFVTVTTLPPATQGVLYLADGVTPVVAGTPITAAQAANLIFDPAPDFNGDVTIPFTVTDNDGTISAPANEVITVNDVNDPPVATPSTSSGDEDTNIPVALVGTDPDGTVDFVTVTTLPPVTQGVLYLADGVTPVVAGTPLTAAQAANLIFDPAPDFNGDVTIPFTVTDNDGTVSAPADEVITVNDVNDPPVATPSTSAGDEDTNIPVALVGTDPDGTVDFVTVTTLPPATQGVLYLADGVTPVVAGTPIPTADAANLVFVPATNFNGDVTIPFTVTDNDGDVSTPANEVITVNDVNDPPVATPSTSAGDEDTNIPVALVGTDPDGTVDFVTVTTLPPATQGVLYLADGVTPVVAGTPITAAQAATLIFDPAPNFNGTVTIPFTVTDNDGGVSTPANEVITIDDVNDPPVATPSISSGNEDTNIPVNLTGTDIDGTVDFVTVTTLPPATQGVLYLANGTTRVVAGTPLTAAQAANLVFTPATNFNGTVTIPFTVTDNDGGVSTAANEVITVNAVNDAPVDGNEARTVYRGYPLSVPAASGLLANATDVDGGAIQISSFTIGGQTRTVTPTTPGSVTIAGVGTLQINSDGSYVFTPLPNYAGPIPIATYTVSDGNGGTDTSTLSLSMAVNRGPVDGNEIRTVIEDTPLVVPAATGLLANATDANGDPLQITQFTVRGVNYSVAPGTAGTANIAGVGSLTINSDGSYVFSPASNYAGAVPVVTYTLSDGYLTDRSTLTLRMQALNDGPIDGNESRTVVEDTPLNVPASAGLLANAMDPEGNPIRIASFTVNGTTFVVTPSAAGVANIAGIGTLRIQSNGAYLFTPVSNYAGPIPVVTYTVSDSLGATDTSTLTLTMQAVNDRPTAVADRTSTPVNTPVVVNLTANDIDPDNDPLTVVSATVPPAQGTLSNVGGVWTFTPVTGFNGEARITYTIQDAQGERSTSTHSVFVGAPPLVALPGSHTGLFDSTMSSSVAVNDTYTQGSTFTLVTPPPSGSLALGPDGKFRFTPTRGFSGTVSFTYQISDQYGQTVTAVETIRVLTFTESCFVTFR
jgi:large repetitive protein